MDYIYTVNFKSDFVTKQGTIFVSHDFYETLDKWCEENCKGKWRPSKKFCCFDFEKEEDAILFKLVWG